MLTCGKLAKYGVAGHLGVVSGESLPCAAGFLTIWCEGQRRILWIWCPGRWGDVRDRKSCPMERKESDYKQAPGGCVWRKLNVQALSELNEYVLWFFSGEMRLRPIFVKETSKLLSASLGKPWYECSRRTAFRRFMIVWNEEVLVDKNDA